MEKELFPSKYFYPALFFIQLFFLLLALNTDGIGQGGDSVFHFLMAKYSWIHPHLFFNHWGKPFFTIPASIFAQFGMNWMKVFNTLHTFIGILFGYKLALHFQIKNAGLILFFVLLAPLSISVNFSGLTEPMFASVLLSSLYFIAVSKENKGAILVSFLPFVRSEGLIILVALAIFFLLKKNWKAMFLLVSGHLIMSLSGMWIHQDILWVFTKIPYAHLNPVYGKGTWDHFLIQMNFMIGPVLYGLLILGLIATLIQYKLKVLIEVFIQDKLFLIYGIFIAFFIAHTSFWALGIFGSMGLTRVFAGVMPLVMIIAIEGLNFILDSIAKRNQKLSYWTGIVLLLFCLIFPFLNNPASYELKRDLYLSEDEKFLKDSVCQYINEHEKDRLIVASNACVPFFLNRDPFDSSAYQTAKNFESLKSQNKKILLVWDPWFSAVEDDISLEKINQDSSMNMLGIYTGISDKKTIEYRLYKNF
ncbi:MAG: hypothetical protein ACOVP1_03970 [Bacteroidia bacterium]